MINKTNMGDSIDRIRVILAWPKDVTRERNKLNKIVDEINRNLEDDKGLTIRLISWDTDLIPGLDRNGVQNKIDSILRIDESDLLIGIFWHRFGTPVKDAKSGTEHEIRKAIKSWEDTGKPEVMLFFSEASPKLADVVGNQLEEVRKFKESIQNTALYYSYKSLSDFETKIRQSLNNFVNNYYKNKKKKNVGNNITLDEVSIIEGLTYRGQSRQVPNNSSFVSKIANVSDEICTDVIRDRFYRTLVDLYYSTFIIDNRYQVNLHSIWESGFRALTENAFINCIKKWQNESPEFFKFDNNNNTITVTEMGRRKMQSAVSKQTRKQEYDMKEQTDRVIINSFPNSGITSDSWSCPTCKKWFPSHSEMSKHFQKEH